MYVKVAFPIPYIEYFTYKINRELARKASPGMLVLAPFKTQTATGVILEITDHCDLPQKDLRDIIGFADMNLAITPDIMALARLTAGRYGTTQGLVFKSALPPGTLQKKKTYFYPGPVTSRESCSENEIELLEFVDSSEGKISYRELKRFNGITRTALDDMIRRGLLSLSNFKSSARPLRKSQDKWIRASVGELPQSANLSGKSKTLLKFLLSLKEGMKFSDLKKCGFSPASANTLHRREFVEYEFKDKEIPDADGLKSLKEENVIELTLWQRSALEKIERAMNSNSDKGFLLYGVTSSGKTQVYLEAARLALNQGKSALVLVPEISLTPQIVERFERFLNMKSLVWHSDLTPSEKYLIYKRAAGGESRLVIGARSAVFHPLKNIGLIVVDEEQDHSYKQDDPAPRYNARDLALERGKINNAIVILGSATPSCETYYAAKTGELEALNLPQRVTGGPKPEVRVVSTRIDPEKSSAAVFPKGFWPISVPLYEELSIRLKNLEQVIMLLNRRGYSSSVVCFECGWVGKCPDCDIGWTYHKIGNKLICHFCGKERRGLTVCQNCGSARLSFRGAGTQKLEEILKGMFPEAGMERLDSDITSKRKESSKILERFGRGEFQILMGTQMVAKGHHFPRVGLSAVIGADIGISLPDFRASEKVLQLLIQAAGRAGRSAARKDPGLVMVQTFSPDNPIFGYLKKEDFTGYLEYELKIRKELNYPPFSRVILVMISATDKANAKRASIKLKNLLKEIAVENEIDILGPAEAPIFKRGKLFRYQLFLKAKAADDPFAVYDRINNFAKTSRGVNMTLDVDPMNFL
jgi:primosomal protein N' (replication factor Y)